MVRGQTISKDTFPETGKLEIVVSVCVPEKPLWRRSVTVATPNCASPNPLHRTVKFRLSQTVFWPPPRVRLLSRGIIFINLLWITVIL